MSDPGESKNSSGVRTSRIKGTPGGPDVITYLTLSLIRGSALLSFSKACLKKNAFKMSKKFHSLFIIVCKMKMYV